MKLNNLGYILLLALLILYFYNRRKINDSISRVTSYFNWSRPFSKQEKIEIEKRANYLYSQNIQELIKSGRFKFPSIDCANRLQKKYGLSDVQRDVLASYQDQKQIFRLLLAMKGVKIENCN